MDAGACGGHFGQKHTKQQPSAHKSGLVLLSLYGPPAAPSGDVQNHLGCTSIHRFTFSTSRTRVPPLQSSLDGIELASNPARLAANVGFPHPFASGKTIGTTFIGFVVSLAARPFAYSRPLPAEGAFFDFRINHLRFQERREASVSPQVPRSPLLLRG